MISHGIKINDDSLNKNENQKSVDKEDTKSLKHVQIELDV